MEPTFHDFYRLVRFTHLEDAYRNAAWVRVDGDDAGRDIVQRLRNEYPTWSPDRFDCFDEPNFEAYYPLVFDERVQAVLNLPDKRARREAKIKLLDEVRAWLDEDADRGRTALEESAGRVIAELQQISAELARA